MPSCLKIGVFGALYPALHIFLIDFFCNISSSCSLYWYADCSIMILNYRQTYLLTVWIPYDPLDNCLTIWLMWSSHLSPSSIKIRRNFAFVDFPVWWMLCYCYKLSSEHSMIICLHRTSLIMLSCHFRYFVVILLGFQKCNILLYCLKIRCILNVLMHVVNNLYKWWIGVDTSLGNPASDAMTSRVYEMVWHKLGPVCQIVPEPIQSNAANTIKMQLFNKIVWSIVSNALERSRNTASVTRLLSSVAITWA